MGDDSIVVSLRNISKMYRLFGSTKDRMLEALHPFRRKYHREFWALRDINLDIRRGSTLGIIGLNGSGKSTLLQIICSVVTPTTGTVHVKGRVAALLELGAGFNPEFTGRQNVIFNGSLSGFTRQEMEDRLPEIEAFADIGAFIYQPVKTYSSGMFVRLAFATAIHVDADILVVDEALAVGDAKFQHKCYRKLKELQGNGKTIIFVTHDLDAVVKHSDHAILIENGSIIDSGFPQNVVTTYYDIMDGTVGSEVHASAVAQSDSDKLADRVSPDLYESPLEDFLRSVPEQDNCPHRKSYNENEVRQRGRQAEIVDYLVECGDRYDTTCVRGGETVHIYVKAIFNVAANVPVVGFEVQTTEGLVAYSWHNGLKKIRISSIEPRTMIVFKISFQPRLAAGDYFLSLGLARQTGGSYEIHARRWSLIHLHVKSPDEFRGIADLGATAREMVRRKVG